MLGPRLGRRPAATGSPSRPRARADLCTEQRLGCFRERRWQRALAAELELDPRRSRVVARYRELVLAARRADADVMLLIPPLALAPASDPDRIRSAEVDAPRARAWQLASRAHARSIRALAGSYAIPAIDTQQGLRAVADALAPRLARTPPACRPALR